MNKINRPIIPVSLITEEEDEVIQYDDDLDIVVRDDNEEEIIDYSINDSLDIIHPSRVDRFNYSRKVLEEIAHLHGMVLNPDEAFVAATIDYMDKNGGRCMKTFFPHMEYMCPCHDLRNMNVCIKGLFVQQN